LGQNAVPLLFFEGAEMKTELAANVGKGTGQVSESFLVFGPVVEQTIQRRAFR